MNRHRITVLAATVALAATITACSNTGANSKESKEVRSALNVYLSGQPIPQFASSQLRQNLIEIITAQAKTTATTTFFFNQGVQDPISSCPSIGFPIPSTAQITASEGKLPDHDLAVPQMEPTGIYTGDSTGTYVICVQADGTAYASYWEGFVNTVTGPASWDTAAHQVKLTGAATGGFTTKVGG